MSVNVELVVVDVGKEATDGRACMHACLYLGMYSWQLSMSLASVSSPVTSRAQRLPAITVREVCCGWMRERERACAAVFVYWASEGGLQQQESLMGGLMDRAEPGLLTCILGAEPCDARPCWLHSELHRCLLSLRPVGYACIALSSEGLVPPPGRSHMGTLSLSMVGQHSGGTCGNAAHGRPCHESCSMQHHSWLA